MKNRIIALLLVIPIILMYCIYSVSNVTGLTIQIPVNGIISYNQQEEYVDISDSEYLKIDSVVSPINATNKGVSYTIQPIENEKACEIEIDENKNIIPKSVGKVKITSTTNEGAYKSSFVLTVGSRKATELEIVLPNNSQIFLVGQEVQLEYEVYPSNIQDSVIDWSVSNEEVAKINEKTGKLKFLSAGNLTIYAKLQDGLNGEIVAQKQIVVEASTTQSGLLVNNFQNTTAKTFENSLTFELFVVDSKYTKQDILWNYNNQEIESLTILDTQYSNKFSVSVVFKDSFYGNAKITARINSEEYIENTSVIIATKSLDIGVNLSNISVEGANVYLQTNTRKTVAIEVDTNISNLSYEVSLSNGENVDIITSLNYFSIKATKQLQDELKISLYKDTNLVCEKVYNLFVLDMPQSWTLKDQITDWGIAELKAVASSKFDGEKLVDNEYQLDFTNSEILASDVIYEINNKDIAKIVNGKLKVINNGVVEIVAKSRVAKLLGKDLKTSIKYRCVKGVEIDNYSDLMKASKLSLEIVLKKSINLGEELVTKNGGTTTLKYSADKCREILLSEVSTLETTADWKYYKYAKNYTTVPTINYCIKFTNNVYGNGFSLNANNITNVVDSTGALYPWSVFNGPLDFVAIAGASVKAQDNVAFLVDDNVTLDNVELIGANLSGNTTSDLTQLNYVGTTCEVVGDNVKIVNSRIRNGRNVLRIFGDDENQNKKLNVQICSSILSYAREFIIKIGTNKKIEGNLVDSDFNMAEGVKDSVWDECAPKIGEYENFNAPNLTDSEYQNLVNQRLADKEFNNLIMTDVTLDNCILQTSGIFAIGMETSFSGPALDGGRWNNHKFYNYGWRDLVGTSYPTKLTIKGKTEIYDWKELSNIDSSSLIEGDLFDFNIAEMIKQISTKNEFAHIISTDGDKNYVHTGIAMFGGGKNYALVDLSQMQTESLNRYNFSFDDINSKLMRMLKCAAGNQPFKFFMFDSTSDFNHEVQHENIINGTMFKNLSKYEY